jgi:acid phosphatase (class A)
MPALAYLQPICSPGEEDHLTKSGSYPSGHSSIGWGWALILAEIAPEQVNKIHARGRLYDQNLVVCNVHWQSDVSEGLVVASATIARLHSNSSF